MITKFYTKFYYIKKIKSTILLTFLFCNTLHCMAVKTDKLSSLSVTLNALNNRYKKIAPVGPPAPKPVTKSIDITPKGLSVTDRLLRDFKHYLTSNVNWHAGDLYQHSVWVSNAVAKFWQEKNHWVEGLNETKDKDLSIFAGLIHDIGKAGDILRSKENKIIKDPATNYLYLVYFAKKRHPFEGSQYLDKKLKYELVKPKGQIFQFDNLFNNLKISEKNKKLVAIIVGMHWKFGGILMKAFSTHHLPIASSALEPKLREYLDQLRCYAQKVNYNNGSIDERLIRLCILIAVADNLGTIPIDINNNIFNIITPPSPPPNPIAGVNHQQAQISQCFMPQNIATNMYNQNICKNLVSYYRFNYETYGKYLKDELLKYFNKNKAVLQTPIGHCTIVETEA